MGWWWCCCSEGPEPPPDVPVCGNVCLSCLPPGRPKRFRVTVQSFHYGSKYRQTPPACAGLTFIAPYCEAFFLEPFDIYDTFCDCWYTLNGTRPSTTLSHDCNPALPLCCLKGFQMTCCAQRVCGRIPANTLYRACFNFWHYVHLGFASGPPCNKNAIWNSQGISAAANIPVIGPGAQNCAGPFLITTARPAVLDSDGIDAAICDLIWDCTGANAPPACLPVSSPACTALADTIRDRLSAYTVYPKDILLEAF